MLVTCMSVSLNLSRIFCEDRNDVNVAVGRLSIAFCLRISSRNGWVSSRNANFLYIFEGIDLFPISIFSNF